MIETTYANLFGGVPPMSKRLAIVVDSFPSLSETFIANEINALESLGFNAVVLTCAPSDALGPATSKLVQSDVVYRRPSSLYRQIALCVSILISRPFVSVKALTIAICCAKLSRRGLMVAVSAVAAAVEYADLIAERSVGHLHAHFLHRPALTARLLAVLAKTTFSFSAHARDVFVPEVRLNSLCRGSKFVAVCSEYARTALRQQLASKTNVNLVLCLHGINLYEYPARNDMGCMTARPWRLLTVCRLVPKKGVDTILKAVALIQQRGVSISYCVAGSGPELLRLRELAHRLHLDQVEFLGSLSKHQINELYLAADLFVLGCRVSDDGDRDGIPNVVLEAMASGLPIVATNCGGVAEAIVHGVTGLLVPPNDPEAIAEAICDLVGQQRFSRELARNARQRVKRDFDLHANINVLSDCLRPLLR